jgi:hypothetical protein
MEWILSSVSRLKVRLKGHLRRIITKKNLEKCGTCFRNYRD